MVLSISSLPYTYLLIPNRQSNTHHFRPLSIRPWCSASKTKPTSTSFDLRSYWTSLVTVIDSELDAVLARHTPEKLYEAMRYTVFCGGAKQAPPVMCIAACELFGTSLAAALPTAAAIEIVNAAALVHDDLPCMDAAVLHRGRPSTHAKYSAGVAMSVGDALFPLAFEHVFNKTPPDLVPSEVLLSVLKEIGRTVGCTAMAAGQLLDATGLAHSGEAEVLLVLEKKFGELAECSAVCGGMLGGAKEDDQLALRRYGRTVGVLYELVDDVLNVSNVQPGKMKNNASVVRTLGMERALELVEQLSEKAKNELPRFGDRYGDRVLPLYSFVDYAVERGFVVEGGKEAAIRAADSS